MKENKDDRLIKREIHGKPHSVRVDAAPGWTSTAEAELRRLLASWTLPGKFAAELKLSEYTIDVENLDFRNLIEMPLRLQTVADLKWCLRSRHVGSFAELQHFYEQLPWQIYLPEGTSLQLRVESFRSRLFHETKLTELISAILRQKGFRLSEEAGSYRLYCEQTENRHAVYVSLSSEPLYHRKYKDSAQHRAPLQEQLAASALQWFWQLEGNASWQADRLLVPFAGSGTLFFEHMIYAQSIALDNWREFTGMATLPAFPAASFRHIQKILDQKLMESQYATRAILIEKDPELLAPLRASLARFLRDGRIPVRGGDVSAEADDFFTFPCVYPGENIFMPLNPPYGLRLNEQPAEAGGAPAYYAKLGQRLRVLGQGVGSLRGFILVPDVECLRAFESTLGMQHVLGLHHFTQGGQHIRCLAFALVYI